PDPRRNPPRRQSAPPCSAALEGRGVDPPTRAAAPPDRLAASRQSGIPLRPGPAGSHRRSDTSPGLAAKARLGQRSSVSFFLSLAHYLNQAFEEKRVGSGRWSSSWGRRRGVNGGRPPHGEEGGCATSSFCRKRQQVKGHMAMNRFVANLQ